MRIDLAALVLFLGIAASGYGVDDAIAGLPRAGLVGCIYERSDLTHPIRGNLIRRMNLPSDKEIDDGVDWSAKWQGYLIGPANAEITFSVQTNRHLILEIGGKSIVDGKGEGKENSGTFSMQKDKQYPVTVKYIHTGGIDGYFRVYWSWPDNPKTAIPANSVVHMLEQEQEWNWVPELDPNPGDFIKVDTSKFATVPARHNVVFGEPGRFGGWPANNGIWIWGDEILVGFEMGYYKEDTTGGHSIDFDRGQRNVLARSLDGGETWTIEDPENYAGDGKNTVPLEEPIDFGHPGLTIRCSGGSIYVSYDCGKTWKGYQFPRIGPDELTSRTDYLVESNSSCLFMLSAKEKLVEADLQDRAFSACTTDGARSFNFLSWVTEEPDKARSVMPSTVRISDKALVTALRRRHDLKSDQRPPTIKNRIDVYQSQDNGATWKFLSKVADTDTGQRNGNPPALLRLKDGRLCVAYGYRAYPYGIRVKISSDNGATWEDEVHLRDDGGTWDLGYPRMVQRLDGKVVTIYYFNSKERPQQHIMASIWDPDQVQSPRK